ncbi:MAG: hypothetical protein ACRETA_13600 [Gammaproteobacteria bacterium]
MTYTALVDTETLARNLDPHRREFACRFVLAGAPAGEPAYGESHIPGGHYPHLDRDLAGLVTPCNQRHP